jgi:hypothetical protein
MRKDRSLQGLANSCRIHHEQRSVGLTKQLQAGMMMLIFGVTCGEENLVSHRSTSATQFRAKDLLMPLGQVVLG